MLKQIVKDGARKDSNKSLKKCFFPAFESAFWGSYKSKTWNDSGERTRTHHWRKNGEFSSDGVKEWEQAPNEVFNGMGKLKRPKLHSALSRSGRWWWRRGKYSFFKEVEVKKNALQTPPSCSPKLHVYTPVMANGLLNAQLKTKRGKWRNQDIHLKDGNKIGSALDHRDPAQVDVYF